MRLYRALVSLVVVTCASSGRAAGDSFVNWENLGVHSLDMTPDGQHLLLANTPDNRLEVFALGGGEPVWVASIPVGLDPVAVRARTNNEAWVVNHISDSVSIVDLTAGVVVATLRTEDEPADVVFAGTPARGFVSCSQANLVQVFDPANLATPPVSIPIKGEDPRAMAVSPDGATVYVAIFESSNATTILGGGADGTGVISYPPNVVNNPAGPWDGFNPPPNDGNRITPPLRPGNPTPIRVGLIVQKDEAGRWMDDNGGDWTEFVSGPNAALSGRVVGWDMPDRDVAAIDADSLAVEYAHRLMNMCMALAVNPADGMVTVIGTDATNVIRFEPNVSSTFTRVHAAFVNPGDLGDTAIIDLNPHLDYQVKTVPQDQRYRSIGDPRAIVWNASGTEGFVAGMGSNNVIAIGPDGTRTVDEAPIPVAEGPIALALDEPRERLYVYARFEGAISVVSTASRMEMQRVSVFDPSPPELKVGRRHLYDTHKNSGLGQSACASCHVEARMDRLAWDLGDPSAPVETLGFNNLGAGILGLRPGTTQPPFENFHPMKGPMTTQTLQDIVTHEPHHWRGDRKGIEAFNPAFEGLLGDDERLTTQEMQEFEDLLATIHFPPNPFRHFNNTLPTSLRLPRHFTTGRFSAPGQPLPNGNAQQGLTLYTSFTRLLDRGVFACVTCHTLPTGGGTPYSWNGAQWVLLARQPLGELRQMLVSVDGSTNRAIKVPQFRNAYEKVGFNNLLNESWGGFGLLHDGSVDTIERFVSEDAFNVVSDQEVADLTAFVLSLSGSDLPAPPPNHPGSPPGTESQDTHAAVGVQLTFNDATRDQPAVIQRYEEMIQLASTNAVALVGKGIRDGEPRGYAYDSFTGLFQSDRATQQVAPDELRTSSGDGREMTVTVVPAGTETRIGIDRDEDGFFDRDELDRCSDPADGDNYPGSGDADGDADVDLEDGAGIQVCFTGSGGALEPGCCFFDFDEDDDVDLDDYEAFMARFTGP
jgi:DNA-binding beta-propeller fold protein YncE